MQPNENPRAINVAAFATARAHEINTMMTAISTVGGTKLAFQRLPRHMQRRAMSHNMKRLPQRLREMARHYALTSKQSKKKEGESQQRKKKSRCHRRRHGNLREAYARRQEKTRWLETHIWHAKRFKMVERWGWKIPLHPSDKSARAAYRATARHCVMSDVSFWQVIELRGQEVDILSLMKHYTRPEIGLTMASKAYLSGSRHGEVILYHKEGYPRRVIGPVEYLWQMAPPASYAAEGGETGEMRKDEGTVADGDGKMVSQRRLWMWVHPSCWSEILAELRAVGPCHDVSVNSLEDELLRFRLQGPLAHPILLDALHVATVTERKEEDGNEVHVDTTYWWEKYYKDSCSSETHCKQAETWKDLRQVLSAAELPTNAAVALTVRDPRVVLPKKRSKVMADPDILPDFPSHHSVDRLPADASISPLWSAEVRRAVADEQRPHHELNELRSQLLVPGTDLDLGRNESRIPILLLQRTGNRAPVGAGAEESPSMLGYGGGWDLVVPRKWGAAFWVGLVFRGARACGVREAGKVALHRNVPRFPDDFPDSESGREYAEAVSRDLERTFLRKPPAKRPNHAKLGIASPFLPAWSKLISEWVAMENADQVSDKGDSSSAKEKLDGWYVLRNREKLKSLRTEMQGWSKKQKSAKITQSSTNGSKNRVLQGKQAMPHINREGCHGVGNHDKRFIGSTLGIDTLTQMLLPSECRTLVWVGVRMVGRGFPSQFAVICLPDTADLAALSQNPAHGGPMEPLHKEFTLKRLRKAEREEKRLKSDKSKRAKMGQASIPEPPSTPADFGYARGGQDRDSERTTEKMESSDCVPSSQLSDVTQSSATSSCVEDCRKETGNHVQDVPKKQKAQINSTLERDPKGNQGRLLSRDGDEKNCATTSDSGTASATSSTKSMSLGDGNSQTTSGEGISHHEGGGQLAIRTHTDLLKSCSREIIGFVTNGAQAFSCGVGMGVGFCTTLGLLKLLRVSPRGKKLVVLVRDIQSLQYRFAYIHVP